MDARRVAFASSSRRPSADSARPSSTAETSMPADATPRARRPDREPRPAALPTSATGASRPAATLAAPDDLQDFGTGIDPAYAQAIGIGMGFDPATRPTTTRSSGGADRESSTSSPCSVSRSASAGESPPDRRTRAATVR